MVHGKSRKLLKRGSHQFQLRKDKLKHALLSLPDDDSDQDEIFPKTEFLFVSTIVKNFLLLFLHDKIKKKIQKAFKQFGYK